MNDMKYIPKYKKFILSVSYNNYNISGGTNKVILAHKKVFEDVNISHVHVFPIIINIPNTKHKIFRYWGITIDGLTINEVFSYKDILLILHNIINRSNLLEIHIHHLMSINIKQLHYILKTFNVPIKFYLHDYFTMCLQYNLLKNDMKYCGLGALSKEKCSDCKHYKSSLKYIPIVKDFFEYYRDKVTFISPSEVTRKIWISAYPEFENQVKVIYHQELIGHYYENLNEISDLHTIKVAFVGAQSSHKGWEKWKEAVNKAYMNKCNSSFYYFGQAASNIHYVKNIQVVFSNDNLNAMVVALRKEAIDVVVLWSICPETYSYTYYESTAANTFIITNEDSGNIAFMVYKNKNGIVLRDEKELEELLCDKNKLHSIVNKFKSDKNYGPSELLDSREIISLLSTMGEININPCEYQKDKLRYWIRRKIITVIYNLYDYIKRIYKKLR